METTYLRHSRVYPNPAFVFPFLIFVLLVSSESLAHNRGFNPLTDGELRSRNKNAGEASRRVLHEPLISIVPSSVPAGAPFESPTESPPKNEPRIPITDQPFFPLAPSFSPPPPPDPSSTIGTPANISGLIPPKEESGNKSNRSKKIIVAIVVTLSVIVALAALLFFLHRRHVKDQRESDKYMDDRPLRSSIVHNESESLRVFQSPAPVTKVTVNGGPDVLYLGTLEPFANRISNGDRETHMDAPRRDTQRERDTHSPKLDMQNGTDVEDFHRESPEIHPLPPLSKRPHPPVCTDSSDEESFYSPHPSTPSSSRSNTESPRISICKRLFSPPPQPQSTVSLQSHSTPSYPSSAATSSPSSLSPLDSPPSPPITPTVLPPPIRFHSHSPPNNAFPRRIPPSRPPPNSKPQPPIAPLPNHQFKSPPPPPPPPPPLFQYPQPVTPSPAKHKLNFQSPPSLLARQKPNQPSPPIEQQRDPPLRPSPPNSESPLPLPAKQQPIKSSPPAKQEPDPPSPPSPPAGRRSQSPLPPLPTRPPPPFLNSSSRSGRYSHLPPQSSKYPPPPPPPPTHNKPSPPELPLPPLPSRAPSRPQLLFSNSTRAGHSLQPLVPTSTHSVPGNSVEQFNATEMDTTPRPKLKPLHWDKVRASPDRAMVWDQLKSGSFELNEEMIETLFVYNTPNTAKTETTKRSVLPPAGQNQRILEPKKSQNVAILLRALNVTREEICDALLEGTCENLGTDQLETLVKMAPSKEEEIRLKEYNGDISKLGPAERFLKALLDIPSAFKRVNAMLYRASFQEELSNIKKSFETLEAACEDLRSSRLFLKLLEAVLKTGNRMNVGTIRGDAQAFKLDTLLKLVDVKGTDGKTTLLHFVVQEIIRVEGTRIANTGEQPVTNSTSNSVDGKFYPLGSEVKSPKDKEDDYRKLGLQVVAGLSTELCNVKKAAGIDSGGLTDCLSNLARGLGKLREMLQTDVSRQTKDGKTNEFNTQGNFHKSMTSFLHQAEEDISQIQTEEKRAFSLVRETTEYFHGDAAKEEAHPLRLFVIVRDFLRVLDQVCKEVGRMQTRNTTSSVRTPPIPVQPISRPIFPKVRERKPDSSDDESLSP